MSSAEFKVVWRWEGWTALNETAKAGAIDSDGNIVLVGVQGQETASYESDDTFEESLAGDFACVRIDGDTGESLWTWTGSSVGSYADVFLAVDTDSHNDVSWVLYRFTSTRSLCPFVSQKIRPVYRNTRRFADTFFCFFFCRSSLVGILTGNGIK